MPNLTIKRSFHIAGCAASLKLKLDGNVIGKIGAGQELVVPIQQGTHTLSASGFGCNVSTTLQITRNTDYVTIELNPRMSGWEFENLGIVNRNIASSSVSRQALPGRFCTNCGKKVIQNSKYCPYCGNQIENGFENFTNEYEDDKLEEDYSTPVYNSNPYKYKASKKNTSVALIVEVVVILLLVFSVLIFTSGDKDNSDKKDTEQVIEASEETIAEDEESQELEVYEEEDIPVLNINESKLCDGLEFIVTGYTFSKYSGGLDGLNQAVKDRTYLVVNLTVKNDTNESVELKKTGVIQNWCYYNFDAIYDNDTVYYGSYSDYADFFMQRERILAHEEMHVVLSFEVPKAVKSNSDVPLSVRFSRNDADNKDYAQWTLR